MEDELKFTQADVDKIIGERLAREANKYNELKTKYDSLTSEHLDILNKTKEYEEIVKEVPKLKRETILNKVAREKQLPDYLVGRLNGETEEELLKDADTLMQALTSDTKNNYKGIPKTPSGDGNPKKTGINVLLDGLKTVNS